jgi:ELWxxDGT repeat protein
MKQMIRLPSLIIALVLIAAAITPSASGQVIASHQITDLNPGSTGSFPTNLYVYSGSLYFSAYTAATGRELFSYNGTNVTLTTNINDTVTDIGGGVLVGNDSDPSGFTTYSNVLYFSAYDQRRGGELWRYNGTNAARVADISPDADDTIKTTPNSSWPQELTVMGNELFFSANSGTTKPNYELWKYNGSSVSQVANIHPDSGSDFSSYPSGLTVFNGALYFMADDGTHGYELWKATSSGATLLADINPGNASSSSYPKYFTIFSNKLYFQAYTSTAGFELWKTDGTNTSIVADLNPGANSSSPDSLTVFRNALYFKATDGTNGLELWKYNGTLLTLVSNINLTGDSGVKNLTVFSNNLYFAANDGVHGWELWKYDGTNASLVVDLNPSGDSFPEHLTVFNNALYFVATTPDTGYEWWKLSGNTVTLAADINPGAGSSYPQAQAVFNGSLVFSATDDGVSNWEPWTMGFAPFQITAVDPLNGGLRLTWKTAGGLTNIVQSSDAVNGAFTNLSDPILIPGSGETTASYTNAINAGSRFFRIVQP